MTVLFAVRLPAGVADRYIEMCDERSRSRSGMARELIEKEVEAWELDRAVDRHIAAHERRLEGGH
jgi:predicted DNA-binding protein